MHTVEALYHLLEYAESLGYGIRHEYLGGTSGGLCEIASKRWLFVDLALNPIEQLDQVIAALRQDAHIYGPNCPPGIRSILGVRRCA